LLLVVACTPHTRQPEPGASTGASELGSGAKARPAERDPSASRSKDAENTAAKPNRTPDVPYEPSSAEAIAAMLRLAEPRASDVVYDLGCGDGRVVIQAIQQSGARGVCVDIDPQRIKEARANAERAGVAERIEFRNEDLFTSNIADASVVLLFLWPEINLKLLPKLLRELAPGTRIVSNMHDMGELEPERVIRYRSAKTAVERGVYLWRVPARAAAHPSSNAGHPAK
jgi:predicted O-methyltransferase YrrM